MCQLNEWVAAKYTQRTFCEKNDPNSPDLKTKKKKSKILPDFYNRFQKIAKIQRTLKISYFHI
jgi:hypothetical protein